MQNPQCTSAEDPVPMIRASLAMLFFAVIVMFVCLQVPIRFKHSIRVTLTS